MPLEVHVRWTGARSERLLAGDRAGDVDLLIALDLAQPRVLPGGRSGNGGCARCGLIAVEIKQLDAQRFERKGNQLFAVYDGKCEKRSVVDQARDAAYGVRRFATASGYPDLYVYAPAWLTQLDEAHLRGVDPSIVGRQGGWLALLAAVLKQGDVLARDDPARREGVRAVRDRFLVRRTLSPLDRTKAGSIARDAPCAAS